MNYWDTSCLLKLYVQEPDSPGYLDLLRLQEAPLFSSVLAETEFAFAVSRKEASGELRPGAATHLVRMLRGHVSDGRVRLVPLGQAVRDLAATLASRCLHEKTQPLSLRTLDGIHLATALSLRATHMITADTRLRVAARFCGLATR